jgi:hypothetical protein
MKALLVQCQIQKKGFEQRLTNENFELKHKFSASNTRLALDKKRIKRDIRNYQVANTINITNIKALENNTPLTPSSEYDVKLIRRKST